MYFVYMIQCEDESLYTGITTDVARRFQEHKSGKGANYTRSHRPKKVLYVEKRPTRGSAQTREAQIKKMTRAKKLMLIRGDL